MKTPRIFPRTIWAHDNGYFVASPELAKKLWMRSPDRKLWYACDIEITSPTCLVLRVYDMLDSARGGIGKEIYRKTIKEFTPEEKAMLDKHVLQFYTEAAANEFAKRELAAQEKKIMKIRKELFNI